MCTLGWAWWLCVNSLKEGLGGGGVEAIVDVSSYLRVKKSNWRKLILILLIHTTLALIFTAILYPINLSSVKPKDRTTRRL